jgi:hypothetical protein
MVIVLLDIMRLYCRFKEQATSAGL